MRMIPFEHQKSRKSAMEFVAKEFLYFTGTSIIGNKKITILETFHDYGGSLLSFTKKRLLCLSDFCEDLRLLEILTYDKQRRR